MRDEPGRRAASRSSAATLAIIVLAVLILPGCSSAAPGNAGSAPTGRYRSWLYPGSVEVLLQGTHGYRITIFAAPLPAKKLTVYLTKGGEKVTYTAPATVTEGSIHASLGALGEVDGSLRASGTVRHVRVDSRCTSNRPPVLSPRLAVFVGRIRLRGEGGFTEATGLPDRAAPRPKAECAALMRMQSSGAGSEEVGLLAGARPDGALTLFTASQAPILAPWPSPPAPPAPQGSFAATISSSRGPVTVERIVQVPAGPGAFSFEPDLSAAQVSPPAPFGGSAEFRRNTDGSGSWTGDLEVDFAGLGEVPLTGGGFKAELGKGSELITVGE